MVVASGDIEHNRRLCAAVDVALRAIQKSVGAGGWGACLVYATLAHTVGVDLASLTCLTALANQTTAVHLDLLTVEETIITGDTPTVRRALLGDAVLIEATGLTIAACVTV